MLGKLHYSCLNRLARNAFSKLSGLVSELLCYDTYPDEDWISTIPNAKYVSMNQTLAKHSGSPLVGGDIYHKSFHNLITIDATEKL